MDCIFRSFSVIVLQIFLILSVTSVSVRRGVPVKRQGPNEDNSVALLNGPNEDSSAVLLNGPNEDNSAALLNGPNDDSAEKLQGPNAEGSVEKLQGLNEDNSAELLNGPNKEGSAEKLQAPNGKSGEELNEPNQGNSKELLDLQNKNKFVEFDVRDNETTAKLLEEEVAQNEFGSKEKTPKPKTSNSEKLIRYSYLDIDKTEESSESSDSENATLKAENQKQEQSRYEEEIKRGNLAESYGTNPHYYQPEKYPDLSRRYAQQHLYKEEEEIILVNKDAKPTNLEPKLASPDLVLAVARESAMLDAARPKNPSEYLIEKESLRSGNYWNAVWKEDVKPDVLRSNSKKPLGAVPAKINPGSNLYDLVTKLKQISPRLLYVINKKIEY